MHKGGQEGGSRFERRKPDTFHDHIMRAYDRSKPYSPELQHMLQTIDSKKFEELEGMHIIRCSLIGRF